MDQQLHKRIEFAANVAIIAVALLLSVVLVKRFIGNSTPPGAGAALNTIKAGEKISLPNTDWSQSDRHLVLVLQKGCHFCAESAPFYQRLIQAVGQRSD